MIDTSKFERSLLDEIESICFVASFDLNFDLSDKPTDFSQKKQIKIRKYILDKVELLLNLPDEITDYLKGCSIEELFLFFEECRQETKRRDEAFEKKFSHLSAETRETLRELSELDCWPDAKIIGKDACLIISDVVSYKKTLLLKNVKGLPKDKEGFYCYGLDFDYNTDDKIYCISGELTDCVYDTTEKISFTFSDAEVKIELYNTCKNESFFESPWRYLSAVCTLIYSKANLEGDYFNAAEKELLPLIEEISALSTYVGDRDYVAFTNLKLLLQKYRYKKIEKLLTKLETVNPKLDKYHRLTYKVLRTLCEKKYEPLWREIYQKIDASQAEYPDRAYLEKGDKLLSCTVAQIQKMMETHGYAGTYPYFVKSGSIKGIHLESSYDMPYFIVREKRARYYIRCEEILVENEGLTISFLCGTAFLKKHEKEEDIIGCLFNANGRRFFNTVEYYNPYKKDSEEDSCDLESCVNIAVKKAECKRLTKEEKSEYYGKAFSGWGLFLHEFVFFGGLYSTSITLLLTLFDLIFPTEGASGYGLTEILLSIPRGWCFLLIWVVSGLVMGIIEVYSKWK